MGTWDNKELLLVVLAARVFQARPEALSLSARTWDASSGTSLIDHLKATGAIHDVEAEALERLVVSVLASNNGDATAALESVGGAALARQLILGTPGTTRTPQSSDPHATRAMGDEAWLTPDEAPLEPLSEVTGRYTHISQHARGGMGQIYLVHDEKMGRRVALKELLLPASESGRGGDSPMQLAGGAVARFLQEGRITAALEHPSIVPVYELGRRVDGKMYYTMKLVRGKTLAALLAECSGLQERLRLLKNFIDICNAIAYAHSRGVIHRDLKPSNVMVGAFGETVVLDWGLAKLRDGADIQADEIRESIEQMRTPHETAHGDVVGTAAYMAPEQARGEIDKVDERSDIYTLGVILYEILTGRVPYIASTASETLMRVVMEAPPHIASLERDVPPELVSICEKAMARDCDQRYATTEALAADIERFMTGALVQSFRYSLLQLARHAYRRHKAIVNTIAAAALIVAGIAFYAYGNVRAARQEARLRGYSAQLRLADKAQADRDFTTAGRALADTEPDLRGTEWDILNARQHQARAILAENQGNVSLTAWTPSGDRLLTVSSDNIVRLHAYPPLERAREYAPSARVNNAAIFPDGARAALAMQTGGVQVIDLGAPDAPALQIPIGAPVLGISVSPDSKLIAAGCGDGAIVIIDLASKQEATRLVGHTSAVYLTAWNADGTRLCTYADGDKIILWDTATQGIAAQMQGDRPCFSPDGKAFAYPSEENVRIASAVDGTQLLELSGHTQQVTWITYSADGRLLLSASKDGTVRAYGAESGNFQAIFDLGEPVSLAALDTTANTLAACSYQGLVGTWDFASGRRLSRQEGHEIGISAMGLHPNAEVLATGGQDGSTRLWDTRTPAYRQYLDAGSDLLWRVRTSASGKYIATANARREVYLYDEKSTAPRAIYAIQGPEGVVDLAFVPGSERMVVTLDQFTPLVIDADTGELETVIRAMPQAVLKIAIGKRAYLFSNDGAFTWTPGQANIDTAPSPFNRGPRYCVAQSNAGIIAAAASKDGIEVLDERAGAALRHVPTASRVTSLAFSQDGQSLAAGTEDHTAMVFDSSTWVQTGRIVWRHGRVDNISFVGEGIVAALAESPISFSSLKHPDITLTLAEARGVYSLAESPSGALYLAQSQGGLLRIPQLAKAPRPATPQGPPTAQIPYNVYISKERLARCISALKALELPQGALRVGERLPAAAVAPLCLRVDDICEVAGKGESAAPASFTSAIESALQGPGDKPQVLVTRGGRELALRLLPLEEEADTVEATFSIEEAKAICGAFLNAPWSSSSQAAARGWGEDPDVSSTVLLVPRVQSEEQRALYARLHIAEGMRVTGINGQPAPTIPQLRVLLQEIITGQQSLLAGTTIVELEAGALRNVKANITIN